MSIQVKACPGPRQLSKILQSVQLITPSPCTERTLANRLGHIIHNTTTTVILVPYDTGDAEESNVPMPPRSNSVDLSALASSTDCGGHDSINVDPRSPTHRTRSSTRVHDGNGRGSSLGRDYDNKKQPLNTSPSSRNCPSILKVAFG